jgi:hypothetical protein
MDAILEILEDLFYCKRFHLLIIKEAFFSELILFSNGVLTS